jgi:hypothetical protein
MSLFKVSKTNSELVPSSALDTQCSVIEEENILNSQSKPLCKNLGGNDIELIISNKDNEAPAKTYSRKEINIFYSKIKLIRKKYNIKKSRKNHIDSLVKKAKSKFLKAIYECLKYCLHSCNLSRLPQKFIINTRIEYNKKVLNKTVEEIYTGFKLLPTYETLMQNNQVYKNRQEFLYSLMKTKLKDIYKYYISSNMYTIDKKRIESKSGEGVVKLYDFVATNICEYFLLNKGNDKRLNRWRNNGNAKKLFVKKKRFEIQKKVENNNNNSSINNININNNKNIYIKFNILKLDNNNINTKSKNSNEN